MNNKHSIDPSHQSKSKHTHSFAKHTRNLSVVLCLGMLAGVLIWSKLRLVTDIPRSAYADPRETMVPDDQSVQSDLADQSDQIVTGALEQLQSQQDDQDQDEINESIPEIETLLPEESEGTQHHSQSPE
ncbi:MAG: hypothetical protein JKX70_07690 [Phycisphaerales bacterium]|nr:hypothetical protein [Phycisphaerales bacterium]